MRLNYQGVSNKRLRRDYVFYREKGPIALWCAIENDPIFKSDGENWKYFEYLMNKTENRLAVKIKDLSTILLRNLLPFLF